MNQSYLDIARRYIDTHPAPAEVPLLQHQQRPPAAFNGPGTEPLRQVEPPVSLDAYRTRATRRCTECGHGLSIIATRALCGRCATRLYQPDTAATPSNQSATDELRGEILAAADRRRYPRLRVLDRLVASGIDEWLPLLREADEAQLRELLRGLERHHGTIHKEADDEHPALTD